MARLSFQQYSLGMKLRTVYHEMRQSNVGEALREGLRRTSRGDKGSDETIKQTDELLDSLRPTELRQAGVSRDDNLYCYLAHGDKVVDIVDGEMKKPCDISKSPQHQLLKVAVDPSQCYVSDLDMYDQIKMALEAGQADKAKRLAGKYWQNLTRLDQYNHGRGFRRPEVMVTYDVPPENVQIIT